MKKQKLKKLLAAGLATAMVVTSATAQPVLADTVVTNDASQNTSDEELSYPQITDFTLSENTVDVSNGDQTVTATAKADSSVYEIDVTYRNEEGYDRLFLRLSNNNNNGTGDLTGTLQINGNMASGTYYPESVVISDKDKGQICLDSLLSPVPEVIRKKGITVKGRETESTQEPTQEPNLQIKSITFDSKELNGPLTGEENVTAVVTLTGEPNYVLSSMHITFKNENGQSFYGYYSSDRETGRFTEEGTCTVTITINGLNQYTGDGTYSLADASISVKDSQENKSYQGWWYPYNNYGGVELDGCESLTVSNNCSDVTPPVIHSITVDKNSISGNGKLHFTANVTDEGGSGLDDSMSVQLERDGAGIGPYHRNFMEINLKYNSDKKCYEADVPYTGDAIDGTYEIVTISVSDRAGNRVGYTDENQFIKVPDNLKNAAKITVNNNVTLTQRDKNTAPQNIRVDDSKDTVTFTAAEGVSYEYCQLSHDETTINNGTYWQKVAGTGTERTISFRNYDIPANSIYIRSSENPVYAAGQPVAVQQPFTRAEKLQGTVDVNGSLTVGSTVTIDADLKGLEEGDQLVYYLYISDTNQNNIREYRLGTKNTFKITKGLVGRNIEISVATKNHSDWMTGWKNLGIVTESGTETPGGGTETPGSGTETPGSGTETPGSGTETPGSGTETPGGGTETPGSGTETPGSGTETPGSGSGSGSGTVTPGGGTGGTVTPGTPTEKPAEEKPVTVTNPDGTTTIVSNETKEDGTKKTTTTVADSEGKTTSVTEETTLPTAGAGTNAVVTVKKDGTGAVTSAKAAVELAGKDGKVTIESAMVKAVADAAGTDTAITMTVKDSNNNTAYTLTADSSDLTAGNSLKVFKYSAKKGYTLVNAKSYKAAADGSVSVSLKDKGSYFLKDTKTASKIEKKILDSVKAAKTSVKVKKGKNTKVALAGSFNKENAKSITFNTTDKKTLKVSKSGTVKALKKGSAVVRAKVVLKNGKTKVVKVKITVK